MNVEKELKDYGREKEYQLNRNRLDTILQYDEKSSLGEMSFAERDYERVLYSSSFRKLQGKMQLFVPSADSYNRNRLTHSLQVAQIARVIAKKLSLENTVTVETCSLAHDIGHPPFGHAGERTLFDLSDKVKFEGNAQTFRILNHLDERHYGYNGLNLSYRTLLGTVKYFNNFNENDEKYLYDRDYDFVKQIKETYELGKEKTIDAEIMDIADEIAYAAHDIEDAFYFKWFTDDELLYEFSISEQFHGAYELFKDLITQAENFAQNAKTYKSSEEYMLLFNTELSSLIIRNLIKSLRIKDNKLCYGEGYDVLAHGLKTLTFSAASRLPKIKLYELKGTKIITKLYEVYMDRKFNKGLGLLPADYRDTENWEESVIDYIAGMMDQQAFAQYELYFGKESLDKLYAG